MDSTAATFDFAALDLRVVTFGYFKARSEDTLNDNSLDDLLGALTLKVYPHDLAIRDPTVLNLNGIVRICKAVDRSSLKVIKSRI